MHRIASITTAALSLLLSAGAATAQPQTPTEGMLAAAGPDGKPVGPCPLEHTDVHVRITGMVARMEVTQKFHNPFDYKIEGVYVFPLSQDAAVDDMTMTVGDRVVRGLIKPREEARQIYEAAKAAGHVASLLDQERANIFTQSVANIDPGARVEIRISYVENLDWEDGTYHFDFPMVVGPRYIPGGGSAPAPMTSGTPTPQVPDADRITPPVIPEGMRAGHDISIAVDVFAGFPIRELASGRHEISVEYADGIQSEAFIRLKNNSVIPNKDFVLTYKTVTDQIADTILTQFDSRGGFFTLILQPPQRVPPDWIVPKEMIFVIDKSGSMSGFPIETAKKTMKMCIENLNPNDTFNLMTFEGGVGFCFDAPVPNTPDNRAKALAYLGNLQGSGGTEMMKAIDACLGGQKDPQRVRVVCFMTDGYVGNDMAIIDAVKKNAGTTRVFSFGIGSSVNRYLLDGMAHAGRGEVEYVLSETQADQAARKFYDRVSTPVLADIELNWGTLAVSDVQPKLIPDLFSAKPVVIKGRYTAAASGVVKLTGRRGSQAFQRDIQVSLPGSTGKNEAIASLWARAKVESLMDQDLTGAQQGRPDPAVKDQIVKLGLEYRLLTQYTSFVAVEETTITRDGQSTKVLVPVEMPEGVSYQGVFGRDKAAAGSLRSLGYAAKAGSSAGGAEVMRLMAPTTPAPQRAGEPKSFGESDADAIKAVQKDESLTPEQRRERTLRIKLAEELRGLAAKLDKDGNFRKDKVKVVKGRIDVAVYLADTSEETMKKLKSFGFQILVQPKSVKMVIGSIEVSKLEELALLEVVQRIQLPSFSS